MTDKIEIAPECILLDAGVDNLDSKINREDTASEKMQTQITESPDFPLDSFPVKIRDIVMGMVKTENFPVEFCASAILSAAAAAMGNAFQIRIKSHWVSNPALFMMIAGRPGLGKTPPLEAAYRPLRRLDQQRLQQYKTELDKYQEALQNKEEDSKTETLQRPTLVQTILSDFTTESMLQNHEYNKRGIAVVVDEIMGMFNSSGKYGKSGNQIESFLSAFSGSPLKVSRKSSPLPFVINHPCISIIGTIQVKRFQEIFAKGLNNSGLMDRFIVVFPQAQKIPLWDLALEEQHTFIGENDAFSQWENLIERITSVQTQFDKFGEIISSILDFSDEARNELFKWRNLNILRLSENSESSEAESREMKRAQIVSKIALVLQILKWACDEGTQDCVDLECVKGAIALSEYYEDCYYRILNASGSKFSDKGTFLLKQLSEEFTTQEVIEAAQVFNISKRSIMKILQTLIDSNRIIRIKQGLYSKVIERLD